MDNLQRSAGKTLKTYKRIKRLKKAGKINIFHLGVSLKILQNNHVVFVAIYKKK